MMSELTIRMYDVGVGDCIHLIVPDGEIDRHILIDCGSMNRSNSVEMQSVLDRLEKDLPQAENGKRVLDLLVITHPHKDHMSALTTNTAWFQKLLIRRIWMSTAMQKKYEPGKKIQALCDQNKPLLLQLQGLRLDSQNDDLLQYLSFALFNEPAMNALRNNLQVEQRLYVDTETPPNDLKIFNQDDIQFHVLNPAHQLDEVYLGARYKEISPGFSGILDKVQPKANAEKVSPEEMAQHCIGSGDFRRLTDRLSGNALGFILGEIDFLENNTSLVLLLEWHGKRLLFAADAECDLNETNIYTPGENNYAWNFMWHTFGNSLLSKPLDFLKVGHHGSINATPWSELTPAPAVNVILDNLIKPNERVCQVGISAERWSIYQRTIPYKPLMEELGARAQNSRVYDEISHYTKVNQTASLKIKKENCVDSSFRQPQRTDMNYQDPSAVDPKFIEFKIAS